MRVGCSATGNFGVKCCAIILWTHICSKKLLGAANALWYDEDQVTLQYDLHL